MINKIKKFFRRPKYYQVLFKHDYLKGYATECCKAYSVIEPLGLYKEGFTIIRVSRITKKEYKYHLKLINSYALAQ